MMLIQTRGEYIRVRSFRHPCLKRSVLPSYWFLYSVSS